MSEVNNNTSTAGTSSYDSSTEAADSTTTTGTTTGTDTTQGTEGTTGTDTTTDVPPQDTAAEDGDESTTYVDDGSGSYKKYSTDAPDYTEGAEEAYADPTYDETTTDDSRRDELLADLYSRMSSAKTQGDQAVKNQNGEEMMAAAEQMAEVIQEAQPAEAELRQEAKADEKSKKKQQEYNQLLNQATLTMKTWKQQTAKTKQWTLAEGEKKGAQQAYKKELDSFIMESLRRKAENDTQSKNKDAKDKYSLLNQIFDGRKGPDGKPVKDQRLSKGEKKTYMDQAAEEGAAPIESALMSESDKNRLKKNLQVKDLALDQSKREATKAKEQEKSKIASTEQSQDAADVKAENDGIKAPTSQDLEGTYSAFLANGKISEDDYKILMEKLKKRDFMRKMNGAGIMATGSDEQAAQELQYSAYRAQFLDNQDEAGAAGKGEATSEEASTFERFTFGMQRAVEGGFGYQAAERARFKTISSTKTFDGKTEEGLFNLSTQVYKDEKSEFVASSEDDKYTHNWTKLKQQAEDQGFVSASKLQSSDPNAAV